MTEPTKSATPAKPPFWRDPEKRALVFQGVFLFLVVLTLFILVRNTLTNLDARGISTGFGFLQTTTGFDIAESLIPYTNSSTYLDSFFVGLLNTILVSVVGIFFATILGFIMGVARLSNNWIVSRLAAIYVDTLRNIPLLLQLFFWYFAVLRPLPRPKNAIELGENFLSLLSTMSSYLVYIGLSFFFLWLVFLITTYLLRAKFKIDFRAWAIKGSKVFLGAFVLLVLLKIVFQLFERGHELISSIYLSNRGLFGPKPIFEDGFGFIFIAILIALVGGFVLKKWAKKRQEQTGEQFPVLWTFLGILIGLPLITAAATGFPMSWEMPVLSGFNFKGGMVLTPEFASLVFALSIYTSSFIAEIVRAGILAVDHGQTEAAYSLGIKPSWTTRLIIVPQALRVIIPPLTSQYLNLTKNSSLAAAIAYPDLVAIFAGTALNNIGQAVEIMGMTLAVYLFLSLAISTLMNWYNARNALVER